MTIDEFYKRRIRIEGRWDSVTGYHLQVIDIETNEEISNVRRIAISLDAMQVNRANVFYHTFDEQNRVIVKDGEPVSGVVILDNPDVSVTAFERFDHYEEYEHPTQKRVRTFVDHHEK